MNGECLILIIILIIEMAVKNNIYGVSSDNSGIRISGEGEALLNLMKL